MSDGTAIKTAVQRGFWRDRDGLVAKKWERKTKVADVRLVRGIDENIGRFYVPMDQSLFVGCL